VPVVGGKIKYPLPIFFSPFFATTLDNRADIQIYFGGAGCYPKGTEFMTPKGWKKIEEYTESDLVLQVDKTLQTSYVKPLDYIRKQVDQFNRIKNRNCDFTTSLEHKHLIKTEKKIVKTVTTEELIAGHNNVRGNKMSFFSTFNYSGQGIDYSDDYIRLKIAVLADGHFPNVNSECYFNVKKQRKVKRIKHLLSVNNIEYHNQKGADGYTRIRFTMDNKEKVFEPYWYNATKEQMTIITEEVLLWDGSDIERSDRVNVSSFSTTSKKSADFVQFAFSSVGVKATISKDNRAEKYSNGDCYSVGLSRHHTMIGISKDNRHNNTTTIKKVKSVDGLMYCFTVPTGFFLVRQNGKIYVSGNSGKSVTIARRTILDMMQGQRNFLIIRKVYGTLKDSFYTELLKAISDLGLSDYFRSTKSPLEIIHKASGKKILFRGLDDKEKIKSITGEKGAITDIVIEEATEITQEDFDMLDTRLRGFADVKKRITMLFNPIYKTHWIYVRFFKGYFRGDDTEANYSIPVSYSMLDDNGVLVQINTFKTVSIHKSTHKDNKFLLPEDHARYEAFKTTNEYYYDVYCQGNWGILGDRIFDNISYCDMKDVPNYLPLYCGLDIGYTDDTAFSMMRVDEVEKKIYIFDGFSKDKLDHLQMAQKIKLLFEKNDCSLHSPIFADSEDPRLISQLKKEGLSVRGASKPAGSVLNGLMIMNAFELVIAKSFRPAVNSFKNYVWETDKKTGKATDKPNHTHSHIPDSCRYGLEIILKGFQRTLGKHIKF